MNMNLATRTSVAIGTLVVSTLIVGSAASSLAAGDWLQFRGVAGQGVSFEKVPERWDDESNIAWKVRLPGPGASSPIVVGDRILVTCYSGYGVPGEPGEIEQLRRHLVCLDRRTGEILWTTETPAAMPEQAKIREDHGYASNTPVSDGQRVYTFYGRSGVYAFDLTGKQLWRADVGSGIHGWGSAASPILFRDSVIVNAGVESESLVALDRTTGKEKWRAGGIRESWNTPILVPLPNGATELIVAIFGKILGFDPATGEELWSCATEIGWYMVPSLIAHDGVVYCVGGRSGGALAVRAGGRGDVTESHRLWTGRKGSNVSSPIYHEKHLYWANDNLGIAYCADATTGAIVYEERLDGAGQIYSAPVLAAGKIYYISRRGHAFVVAAKPSYEVLSVNQFSRGSGVFNASPAIADGTLYLRSDSFLFCIQGQ
jgi:hypothetical protein